MMATALENNGATVYILGRRLEVLENAARQNAVCIRGNQNLTLALIILQKHDKMVPVQCDVTSNDNLLSVSRKFTSSLLIF